MKKKIRQAIKRIQVASHIAERHGEALTVFFNGGKDSQVMLHLVQRAGVPSTSARCTARWTSATS